MVIFALMNDKLFTTWMIVMMDCPQLPIAMIEKTIQLSQIRNREVRMNAISINQQ